MLEVLGALLWVKELPSCSGYAVKSLPMARWMSDPLQGGSSAPFYPEHAPILLFGVLQSGWRSQTIEDQFSTTCR